MKRIYILRHLIVALVLFLVQAQTAVGQFTDFEVNRTEIAPGIIKLQIIDDEMPLHVVALEIDISVPENDIRTVLAHNKLGTGFEYVDSMAIRYQSDKEKIIGAINADFFHIRSPKKADRFLVSSMMHDGKIIHTGHSDGYKHRTHFGIEHNGNLFIGPVDFYGFIRTGEGSEILLNGINIEKNEREFILYNSFFNDVGQIEKRDNQWVIIPDKRETPTDTLKAKISNRKAVNEEFLLDENNFLLLAGKNIDEKKVQLLNEADKIEIFVGLKPHSRPDRMPFSGFRELTGGGPHLLLNGRHAADDFSGIEGFSEHLTNNRHNRSAVGFSHDSTKVIFAVIDGRQPDFSVGATLYETADIMLKLRAWNAVNLDGGGSSTLVIDGEIVNRHDETGTKRRVANALLGIIYQTSDKNIKDQSFK